MIGCLTGHLREYLTNFKSPVHDCFFNPWQLTLKYILWIRAEIAKHTQTKSGVAGRHSVLHPVVSLRASKLFSVTQILIWKSQLTELTERREKSTVLLRLVLWASPLVWMMPLSSRCSSLFHVQNSLNAKEAFFFSFFSEEQKPLLSYVGLIVKRGSKCSWSQQRRMLCSHRSDTPDSHYRGSSSFLPLMTKWKLTRRNHGTVRHTGKINSPHVGLACSCTGSSMRSGCCQSGLCSTGTKKWTSAGI